MFVGRVGPVDRRSDGERSRRPREFEYIRYETIDDGRIAAITLDRPKQRNAQTRGMPGPCSGAPNAVTFRADVPCRIVDGAVASGAAAKTPGARATWGRSIWANGVEPRNGPAAPALTTNASTPMESTVRSASTRNPFTSPVRTSVIAKTRPVLTIAMTRRRFRHWTSRKAAKSMRRKLPASVDPIK